MEKALQQHYICPTSEIRTKLLLIPNEQIKRDFFLNFLKYIFEFLIEGEYFKKKSIGVRGRLGRPVGRDPPERGFHKVPGCQLGGLTDPEDLKICNSLSSN